MKEFKTGFIHQIETMGLVDGPGIRIVIFMQGCPLRCLFCHNPETWEKVSKNKMTSKEIVDEIRKYRPYIEKDGGVTFSGGEPLLQSEFLLEMLKMCNKAGIHTALDTSGTGYNKKYLDEILKYTDLVILDIKAIDEDNYKKMTGKDMTMFNYFVDRLLENNNKIWLRQVIVPNINDTEEYIFKLKKYIKKFKNIEKIELLPYHTMGKEKYDKLNIKYRLTETLDMDKEKCKNLEELLNK
ncbi:MAG: pyruvate formate lyase-activating protein [Firmicutes bacterium]|nr:pyruvate formate lyase-activating protein [Bacillota bacterium]